MRITRRPFLKLILASIAGWCSKVSASQEPFSTRKPTLLTFYGPCRVWVSESTPSLAPKSAKYWLKISTGEVFKFDGVSWKGMDWSKKGREVKLEGREIGWVQYQHPETVHDEWVDNLGKLPSECYVVKCEGCSAQIDFNSPKMYATVEKLPNGGLWETIHKAWDNIPIEVDGSTRQYRLCESCIEKATITYDL